MPEAHVRYPGGLKLDYRVGDKVSTPLGSGIIVEVKHREKPEGDILCRVKHFDFCDHDGDTFDLDVLSMTHLPED